MVSPKAKHNLSRIVPFGVIWLLIGWVFMWSEYAVSDNQSNTLDSEITVTPSIFFFASISVFLVGLLVGSLEILLLNRMFERLSFAQKIWRKLLLYTLLMSALIFVLYMLAASIELQKSVFSAAVWDKYLTFFFSITHLSTSIQLAFSLLVSLIYAEISDNLGHGVLLNFFTGKYHQPVEEQRIFMFSDMKSSTAIAEKLGHSEYFKLLKAYYSDFSAAIIQHSGAVYQYIGDEIVISWKFKEGIQNNNCIHCFFAMRQDLQKRAEWYRSNFGVVPTFKAALHVGMVTTGEVGALKKEIIFTGDVLNTTARIQELCNSLKVDLLISKDLLTALSLKQNPQATSLGLHPLKGKEGKLELFQVHL